MGMKVRTRPEIYDEARIRNPNLLPLSFLATSVVAYSARPSFHHSLLFPSPHLPPAANPFFKEISKYKTDVLEDCLLLPHGKIVGYL
jgi:hypothetical protein